MKKLLALAIAVSTPALADVYTDVNYKNSDQVSEAAAKVGYVMDNGLSVDLENVYDFKNKENKEITLGTAWKYEIIENGYIQPLAEVTFGTASDKNKFSPVPNVKFEESTPRSNTYKLGLKGGYNFNNGIYTSLRYRYEMNDQDGNFKINAHNPENKDEKMEINFGLASFERVHRTDLTIGYVIEDIADLSVNWIYKAGSAKVKGDIKGQITGSGFNSGKHDVTKLSASSSDIELKAAANGLGDFVPYIQYTIKSDVKVKDFDIAGENLKGGKVKAENEIKVGLVYNF